MLLWLCLVNLVQNESSYFHLANYNWSLNEIWTHTTIRIRAVVQCTPGELIDPKLYPELFNSYSNEVLIEIDRVPPTVFSFLPVDPFPGVDNLQVTFTEAIR